MKDILYIGGPEAVQGVDRIKDDVLSILTAEYLYDRKAVVVWPSENFFAEPADTSLLESHLDMHALKMDQMQKQDLMSGLSEVTPDVIYELGERALSNPSVRSEAVMGEALGEVIHRLSKLVLAVSGGQNLVLVIDDPPGHALCWTQLVTAWATNAEADVMHYDSASACYGVLNAVKEWPLSFTGLLPGVFTAADLVPMKYLNVKGHSLPIDQSWYEAVPNALSKEVRVEYPVIDRFGSAKAMQVDTDGGYMLVIPKPDKLRNFTISLKTAPKYKAKAGGAAIDPMPTKASTDQYMTRKDVAELLNMTTRTVDRRIDDGKLKSTKVGSKVLILKSSVDKLLEG